jgi:hypothetical protein
MPWNTNLFGTALNIAAYQGAQLRVVAGPGTGKTHALMRRVAVNLLRMHGPNRYAEGGFRFFTSRRLCLVTNGAASPSEVFSNARQMAVTSSLGRTGLTR